MKLSTTNFKWRINAHPKIAAVSKEIVIILKWRLAVISVYSYYRKSESPDIAAVPGSASSPSRLIAVSHPSLTLSRPSASNHSFIQFLSHTGEWLHYPSVWSCVCKHLSSPDCVLFLVIACPLSQFSRLSIPR